MNIALVTTCMGRLDHLKKSLPRFCEQDNVHHTVYVVNWSSPDGLEQWFDDLHYTNARRIDVTGKRYFHLSAARNVGGRIACEEGADLIGFVDADILLPRDFLERNHCLAVGARQEHGGRFFLQTKKLIREGSEDFCIWGSCMVPAETWRGYEYNEKISTYGHEDNELYSLWVENGIRHLPMCVEGVTGIKHNDASRMSFYREDVSAMRENRERNKLLYRGKRTDLF